ncbi:sensor histidine kinase [Rhodocytophaga rosea]|uniref:Sensor histidine kinase n=1 Tax=Rhodocytophaga rosea TaxID=2704465 RepID=A0A6C0GLT0_9BACT|nr:histidine kinase [Rhodocytophaga rosea]QHT69041.1 sensor histidine kinase [Rhodocytophaga rosea]
MNRITIYWICQIAGWTAYCLNDLGIYSYRFGYSDGLLINAAITIVLGISVTHAYRLVIKRLSWLDLPLSQLVPRIAASVLLMAIVMVMLSILLDYYTVPDIRKYFSLEGIVFFIINWGKHLLLWSVIYHLFQYFERSKKNEVEKVRLTSSVRDFEAKILRSQLNPHFMFNSLNSIRALILENPEKAQISVTRLSNLLRNSLLADRRKTVTLEEELKTVQDYLALEKIRYEDRLSARMNIQPEALPVQVPPMMVQTLVENAVKHGISKPLKGGFITVDAEIKDDKAYISIRNTGVLHQINSDGFGLVNTTQRLALIFGSQANFEIKQEAEEVVCAQVILPAHPSLEPTRKEIKKSKPKPAGLQQ